MLLLYEFHVVFNSEHVFCFWIPNPSTGSEPQHVSFKRSKQHLLDFTTASRSPGTIQKATWSKYLMMMEIVMFHLAFYSHRFFQMHLNCSPYFTRLLVTSTYACQGGNLHLSIQTSIFHVPRWNSRRFVGHVISIRPPWAKNLGKGNQCASLHLQKGRDEEPVWIFCRKCWFVSDYWTQLMGSLRYSRIACGWVKVKVNPRNSQVERDCRITFLALAHKCMAPTWIMNLHDCDPGLKLWLGRFVLGERWITQDIKPPKPESTN